MTVLQFKQKFLVRVWKAIKQFIEEQRQSAEQYSAKVLGKKDETDS